MTKEQEEKIVKIVGNMSDEEIEDRIRQDEQEKAIENLTDLLKQRNEKQVQITTYDLFENIETVLSMLKENSAEIEQKNTELAEKNAEIEKKDKIIDLMAEEINQLGGDYDDFCIDTVWNEDCDEDCKNCIKQYFERKSEE